MDFFDSGVNLLINEEKFSNMTKEVHFFKSKFSLALQGEL